MKKRNITNQWDIVSHLSKHNGFIVASFHKKLVAKE